MLERNIFIKIGTLSIFILFSGFLLAQTKYDKHLINNLININYPDSTVSAEIYHKDKVVKPRINRYYIWYRANDIKTTRGGYDGKLIHGDYTVFYHDKSLKEKGKVRKGQKKGRWIRWYANGEIYEIMHWKKGQQHGVFEVFNEKGELVLKGKNYKGKVNGKLITYLNSKIVSVKKYKNGVFVEDVEVKQKEVKVKKEKKKKEESKSTIEEQPIQDANQQISQQNTTQQQQNQIITKLTWKQKIAKPWVWLKSKFKKKEKPTSTPQ